MRWRASSTTTFLPAAAIARAAVSAAIPAPMMATSSVGRRDACGEAGRRKEAGGEKEAAAERHHQPLYAIRLLIVRVHLLQPSPNLSPSGERT